MHLWNKDKYSELIRYTYLEQICQVSIGIWEKLEKFYASARESIFWYLFFVIAIVRLKSIIHITGDNASVANATET